MILSDDLTKVLIYLAVYLDLLLLFILQRNFLYSIFRHDQTIKSFLGTKLSKECQPALIYFIFIFLQLLTFLINFYEITRFQGQIYSWGTQRNKNLETSISMSTFRYENTFNIVSYNSQNYELTYCDLKEENVSLKSVDSLSILYNPRGAHPLPLASNLALLVHNALFNRRFEPLQRSLK